MSDFSPKYLDTISWAFATAAQSDTQLFTSLAMMPDRRMGDFNSQGGDMDLSPATKLVCSDWKRFLGEGMQEVFPWRKIVKNVHHPEFKKL